MTWELLLLWEPWPEAWWELLIIRASCLEEGASQQQKRGGSNDQQKRLNVTTYWTGVAAATVEGKQEGESINGQYGIKAGKLLK